MTRLITPERWDEAATHYERTAHPFTQQFTRDALTQVTITPETRLLDIAAGTGALALLAARAGAQVLATDFSPGMVARIAAHGLPNVDARVMDGQALDLPDAAFDLVCSTFGVMMFPDWRKGLAEMARVTRPGGTGLVATWETAGAATFMLLTQVRARLFPDRDWPQRLPEGVLTLAQPGRLAAEYAAAGYRDVTETKSSHDFLLEVALLDDPGTLFGMSEDWALLTAQEQAAVVAEVRRLAEGRDMLPIPSTAIIVRGVR